MWGRILLCESHSRGEPVRCGILRVYVWSEHTDVFRSVYGRLLLPPYVLVRHDVQVNQLSSWIILCAGDHRCTSVH